MAVTSALSTMSARQMRACAKSASRAQPQQILSNISHIANAENDSSVNCAECLNYRYSHITAFFYPETWQLVTLSSSLEHVSKSGNSQDYV
jgi:hypothetical protein